MHFEFPNTWQEALASWDAKEPVFTIELGGVGPSYEQAMHIAIFEVLRLVGDMDIDLHKDTQTIIIQKAIKDANEEKHLRLTSAQADSILLFILRVLTQGWVKTITQYPTDRRIQVTRWFPGD
jgi:hypothetical protein